MHNLQQKVDFIAMELYFSMSIYPCSKKPYKWIREILVKGVKSVRSRVTTIREHLAEDIDILTFKQILLESILKRKISHVILLRKQINKELKITHGALSELGLDIR